MTDDLAAASPADAAALGERKPGSFDQLRRATLRQGVVDAISESIVRGDFVEDAPLPAESELATTFGVSRPVVREAMRQLVALGLVHSHQGSRTRIAKSDEWNHLAPEILEARMRTGTGDELLLQLLELRRTIEVGAAALAAERANDADLTLMEQRLAWLDGHLEDELAFVAGDLEFHDAILRATRNELMPRLVDQLRPILAAARSISARVRPGGVAQSQLEHREIFAAILAGDRRAAHDAMTNHLSWTADLSLVARDQHLRRKR